ncbi:MAG: ABC transporter substrate-binding protein, partial [Dehalococcoidia bacterium]
ASHLGVPEEQTVNMMLEQINAAGGVNGHPLEVIIYDDETSVEKCVTLTNRLIEQDNVLAIIGPTTSGNSLGIIETVTAAEIPLISCAASTLIVEPVEERYWVFKTPQTDKEAVTEIYIYMQEQGFTKVALITDTSGFGAAGRDILVADAGDYGITIVDDQTFASGDTSMQSQLTHIGGTDAEAVICWATDKESATVATDMQTLQMDIPLFCSHGIANMAFITNAGDAANGVIFPAGKLLILDDIPTDDPQYDVLTQYTADYEAYTGETVSTFGGHAYDALSMVVIALEQLDEGLDVAEARAAIRDAIEQITGFAGTGGVFNMSPTNHLGMVPGSLAMIEIVDGEWTQIQPSGLPDLLSVVDEFESLMTAADRDAQIVAFGDLSTAIEEIGDDELNTLLRAVVTQGMVSDEASAVAMVDMAAHMLSVCAASVEAFPAEVQPMLELADEIEAVIAAEDVAAQTAAFGELSAAVSAIGNDDLSAKLQNVITGGMQSELAGNMALGGMISWILMQAAEAAQ